MIAAEIILIITVVEIILGIRPLNNLLPNPTDPSFQVQAYFQPPKATYFKAYSLCPAPIHFHYFIFFSAIVC